MCGLRSLAWVTFEFARAEHTQVNHSMENQSNGTIAWSNELDTSGMLRSAGREGAPDEGAGWTVALGVWTWPRAVGSAQ
ncbi:hypothetical protein GCM10017771_45350 [Streptomyces capitiformicae]|uniref:Uncharacterized protein n=1 Tax=Streptomyces capitiformicae TaxID=2014920 RepID=A0A918YY92_9ACTN|nr:hypothetical protein GCM10017771_45350 [Streptomyces capitiformicae]